MIERGYTPQQALEYAQDFQSIESPTSYSSAPLSVGELSFEDLGSPDLGGIFDQGTSLQFDIAPDVTALNTSQVKMTASILRDAEILQSDTPTSRTQRMLAEAAKYESLFSKYGLEVDLVNVGQPLGSSIRKTSFDYGKLADSPESPMSERFNFDKLRKEYPNNSYEVEIFERYTSSIDMSSWPKTLDGAGAMDNYEIAYREFASYAKDQAAGFVNLVAYNAQQASLEEALGVNSAMSDIAGAIGRGFRVAMDAFGIFDDVRSAPTLGQDLSRIAEAQRISVEGRPAVFNEDLYRVIAGKGYSDRLNPLLTPDLRVPEARPAGRMEALRNFGAPFNPFVNEK